MEEVKHGGSLFGKKIGWKKHDEIDKYFLPEGTT